MKRELRESLSGVELLPVPLDIDTRVQRKRASGSAWNEHGDSRRRSRAPGLAVGFAGLILVLSIAWSLSNLSGNRPEATGGGLRVVCTAGGPVLSEGLTMAGEDGVLVTVLNRASAPATVTIGEVSREFQPGETVVTLPVPPGTAEVGCVADGFTSQASYSTSNLLVQDPNGFWMASSFSCSEHSTGSFPGYSNPARPGEPTDLAKEDLAHTQPDDTFTRIEYSDPDTAIVVVVRDGQRVARAAYRGLADGQWVFAGSLECASGGGGE